MPINDLVDRLADVTFHRAIKLHNFFASDFHFEKIQVKQHRKKITSNLCREMDNHTGEQTSLKNFAKSGIISRENFQTVWWDVMENLIKRYRKIYQVWLTKHVQGYCGTNKHLLYSKREYSD